MKHIKLFSLLCTITTIVFCLSGCSNQTTTKNTANEPLQVCTNATFVPFEFKDDASSSDYKGFEIDLLNEISHEIGRPVVMNNIPFAGIIPALQQHTMDLGASGITLSAERAKKVAFSAPFYESKLVLLVPINSEITSLSALHNKTVAVQMGTTAADYCTKNNIQTKQFDHNADVIMELQVGGSPAGILDKPVADYYLQNQGKGKFKVINLPNTHSEYLAFAMNKDNSQLQEEINTALATVKANGKVQKIYQKWFGENPPMLPNSAEKALLTTSGQ